MSITTSLYINQIQKKYPGYMLHVQDVEFISGTFNSVLGPSGSGKSTFLRTLCGLIDATNINVVIGDKHFTKSSDDLSSSFSYIFQNYNLISRITVLHNVLLGNLVNKRGLQGIFPIFSKMEKTEALRLLDSVDMLKHAYKDVSELSGGQMQRVAIARALAKKPKVILADEPIASLDPELSKTIIDLFQGICREHGVTLIATLHQPEFAYSYSHKILKLVDGIVSEVINCNEVRQLKNV